MKDDNKMEELLKETKKDAQNFFSNFPYENMNKAVLHQLKKKKSVPHKYLKHRFKINLAVTSILFAVLLMGLFHYKGRTDISIQDSIPMGEPVSQQILKLNNEEINQWLYFIKINKPYKIDNNLLAVIWKSKNEGDYEIAYSSLFENSTTPLPAGIIAFPGNKPPVIVISSKNDDGKYIHYRILGYKENKVLTYIEQNYVQGGQIEVVDGALKETRLAPQNSEKNGNNSYMDKIVTYYIPYQIDKTGDIILSLEKLKINKGDYIAIFGDENVPIEILKSKLLLNWEMGSNIINEKDNVKFLYAENLGYEDLYIKPLKGGMLKKINIEVVENDEDLK